MTASASHEQAFAGHHALAGTQHFAEETLICLRAIPHAQNHIKDAIWPITTAVPLPRHAADSTGRFVLLENGKPVPAQFTTRARWYPTDGEIKWMGVDFQARYDNGKPRPYVVKQLPRGKAAPALDTPLKVTEHADRFEINTGKIAFTVNRKSFAGIEQAQWVNKDGSLGELLLNGKGGPFLTDERLYDYNSAMVLRIAERQVEVTVFIQIEKMDALENPFARYVKVLSRIAESSPPKSLKPARGPDV